MARKPSAPFELITTVPALTQSGGRWQYLVPVGFAYRIRSIVATLTASATVGNRNMYFMINAAAAGSANGKLYVIGDTTPVLNVTAGIVGVFSIVSNDSGNLPAIAIDPMAATHAQIHIPALIVPPGHYISFQDRNGVDAAGDVWSLNRFVVEAYSL